VWGRGQSCSSKQLRWVILVWEGEGNYFPRKACRY
jgi:hypothetical protein